MIKISIDGTAVEVEDGTTVLEAARRVGIEIPALCAHPALRPVGACKMCAVETAGREGPSVKLACVLKAVDGMSVRTNSPKAKDAQVKAFTHLLQLAPGAEVLTELAERLGLELPPPPDGCLRCKLCTRVCKDVVGAGALKMERRDGINYIAAWEGLCIGCGTCVSICPTKVIRLRDENGVRTIMIRDEVIGRQPLSACESCGRLFVTEKNLHRVEERAVCNHPDVKEHHRFCPACAKILSPRVLAAERTLIP